MTISGTESGPLLGRGTLLTSPQGWTKSTIFDSDFWLAAANSPLPAEKWLKLQA